MSGYLGTAAVRLLIVELGKRNASRMDASDHWVAYAHVIGGTVSKKEAVVASHRRKVATYY